MSVVAKHYFWRRLRVYFRRFRITVLLALLALLCALLYLHLAGLPDFAKRWVVEEMRSRGVELEFSRLHLDWYSGIVADDVKFGRMKETHAPRLTARRVSIHPGLSDLARLRLTVDSAGLHGGRIEWPASATNASLSVLNVTNIEAWVRFRPGDEWVLDDLTADFLGMKVSISCNVTNASAVPRWKWFQGKQPDTPDALRLRLEKLADLVGRFSFSSPPSVRIMLNGDGRRPERFTARLLADAKDIRMPWGDAGKLTLLARLYSASEGEDSHSSVDITASGVRTPWAEADHLHALTRWLPGVTNKPSNAHIKAEGRGIHTRWADASELDLRASLQMDSTNAISAGGVEINIGMLRTPWAGAQNVALRAQFSPGPGPRADASLGLWTNAFPWAANLNVEVKGLAAQKFGAESAKFDGYWSAPVLILTNAAAELSGGRVEADAGLDVLTRKVRFALNSTADPRGIEPFLTEGAQAWLSDFSWRLNPHLSGSGAVTLPAWTNRHPDWRAEVQPTLQLDARFAGTNVAYRGISADSASSRVTYTNMFWNLPDLVVCRPEGELHLAHRVNDRTKDYEWRVEGPLDPRLLRPLLASNQLKGFDLVTFNGPINLNGDVRGRLRDYDRINFDVNVSATNFSVRGQEVETFDAQVRYTNRVLELWQPNITRGAQLMYADGIRVDFNSYRIHFTNGFSMVDPQAVADAIGPKVGHTIMPYHFVHPPVAKVNGYAPLSGATDADLWFVVEGGPFEWWKFKVPQIEGTVHWHGQSLDLSNMRMKFYDGDGAGWAHFDFHPETTNGAADFQFTLDVTNVNLNALMGDLGSRSNRMEGVLNGTLTVTDALTTNWHSWNGYGHANLADGFLWDVPLFGVFSPILNGILPGLGGGYASDATAQFIITNGVIYSDSLNIRSTMMRLNYEGTVDFTGEVNARVEAELLRDTWLLGRALSLVLKPVTKLLEYRVAGTLSKPKPEPLYFVPRLLMIPLHPIRTIEEWFPSSSSSTNTPTAVAP